MIAHIKDVQVFNIFNNETFNKKMCFIEIKKRNNLLRNLTK